MNDGIERGVALSVQSRIVWRLRRARKDAARRLKFARELAGRAQKVQKNWYFRARQHAGGRMLLRAVGFARAPLETRRRRRLAGPYIARLPGSAIDHAAGYELLSFDPGGGFGAVLAAARRVFEIKKAELDAQAARIESWSPDRRAKYLTRKQSFLRYLLNDEDLRRHPELVEFALGEATLGRATQYFGSVPLLTRVDLVYSLPRPGTNINSQLFHLDPEGLKQVKFFIHLFDVADGEGPFTFIPADASARILRDVWALRKAGRSTEPPHSRRYSDEEVAAVGAGHTLVAVKGPAGAGVAVDTSRCLHLGSRVQPGTFRAVLYLQYCTTREETNVFDAARFQHDRVKALAVAHSVEPGRPHPAGEHMTD